jgi:thymidine kinase
MDYSKKEFGPMPNLLAIADSVRKTKAVCFKCRRRAAGFTQRISGSEESVQVGDAESYEARCIKCHYVFRQPKNGS